MGLSITQVPIWLSAVFVVSFYTSTILLINNALKIALERADNENSFNLRRQVFIFFTTYFLLVGVASLSGFFAKNVLPPRIILFTTIPLFIFYVFYFQRTQWFKKAFKSIKLEELIYIHIFRFVGVFFFLVYHYEAIPRAFAFIGGIGDIVSAILVFPVIAALKKALPFSNLFAWIWNIIGLLDIVAVLVTAIALTKVAAETNGTGVQQFTTFPFCWIPAFAPATIIFIHILIFKKLRERL